MPENESDVAGPSKKKVDKNQSAESLVVTVDKKADKSDGDETKPRIVLTFRSEKSGTKSSNMKIVSNEDKHEEFSPRRSSRTRGRWEWSEDNDSVSPKKDKSVSQSVSENDEASDSSHTTPKRSTRRRSKDSSDNVLANAIARKEKSYNETSGPTQRLSRRIKPTAKVLENEELRIGVESQNNARLGLQDKQEEGVRTRRSAKSAASEGTQNVEKKDKSSRVETRNSNDKSQSKVMKLKHLCELGLQAINLDSTEDDVEIRDTEDNEIEVMDEDEEEEIDDDSEVISKLLEADEDTASESSDEEFYCSAEASETERPRRSHRLNSTYGMNDSDCSSPIAHGDEEKAPPRRSSRRTNKHYIDDTDRAYMPRRKKNRASRGEEAQSEAEQDDNSNPAAGDEGSEAACPDEESTVVATCLCEKPSNIYPAPEELTEPVFCQAIEMVDGVRVGCSHPARREGGKLAALQRAGPRAPYVLACSLHAAQLQRHMCCPACGLFCTQGIFYQCSEGHLFHLECGLPTAESKLLTGCPHCGVLSYRWQPVNRDCSKVHVQMHCSNKRIFLPDQREQCTPAYLSFSTSKLLQEDEQPLIPEDLLPSNLEDLKRLCEKPESTDYEELLSGSPAQTLCDAILAGESIEQLIPKIASVADVNEKLECMDGGTCAHAAARSGRAAALGLLRGAGARLDAADGAGRTPLLLAVRGCCAAPARAWTRPTAPAARRCCSPCEVSASPASGVRRPRSGCCAAPARAWTRPTAPAARRCCSPCEVSASPASGVRRPRSGCCAAPARAWTRPTAPPGVRRPAAALGLLRGAGARLDAADGAGRTPLLLAVRELVDKNDEISKKLKITKDTTEETKLDENKEEDKEDDEAADTKQQTEIEKDEKETDELKPSDEDLLKVIRYLIAAGCDVNFPGPEEMTALHVCGARGGAAGAAAARALLAAPAARPDARDAGGWTPLAWAADHQHPALVRLFLSAGADAGTIDNEGNGAIHWCALGGNQDALLQLLTAAPHVLDAGNAHGDTPLHVAARQGHYACVVILLAHGARTDIANSAGEVAASVCANERCEAAISLAMHMRAAGHAPPPRLLSNDISRGREYYPVPCENEVDDEPLPDDFTYVTQHVMPQNIAVDYSIPTMQGCSCAQSSEGSDGACCSASCACVALGVRRWYDARGRLAHNFPYHDPPMLFECNQTCGCDLRKCGNSVVTKLLQRGSLGVRTAVFRTGAGAGAGGGGGGGARARGRGWGLRARQAAARGAAVAAYCGELLPLPEADTRAADQYMFALDVKPDLLEQCSEKSLLCVDAARYGSAARFINHSCRPNVAPVRVYTHTRDLRLPTVALFATRDIAPHEELTFDYGDKFWSVKSKWMKCECGASDCRYPEKSGEDSEG
ncbi:histone-lysine N-methyltransferase EHMT2 [Galleria mellonella]|uniref:Histone-lysine N-methyltransferase EHMT2 n=1 Tax=Galleria mellonella TaxID=7137 RepID=A0ABM3N5F3_GALME|nr:histone-lysine N-methyltransferase EHMT2 [Galleria mellonella]